MEAQALSRIRLTAAIAVASVAAVATVLAVAAASGGPASLPPDLVTLRIGDDDLQVKRDGPKTLLRLSNEIGNRGNGPLEVFPGPVSADCDGDADPANDRDASQRLFADSDASGLYEAGVDAIESERRFGCMRFHAAHDHWHVLDFARYELRRERGGKLVTRLRKVGFCLVDNRRAFANVGSPPEGAYPFGSAGDDRGCDASTTQGLSPGWADIYTFAMPGQQLNISGLPRGRYCLVSEADPIDLLDELDEDNNARETRIALNPQRLSATKLRGRCRT